jgi:hypothetical protein
MSTMFLLLAAVTAVCVVLCYQTGVIERILELDPPTTCSLSSSSGSRNAAAAAAAESAALCRDRSGRLPLHLAAQGGHLAAAAALAAALTAVKVRGFE